MAMVQSSYTESNCLHHRKQSISGALHRNNQLYIESQDHLCSGTVFQLCFTNLGFKFFHRVYDLEGDVILAVSSRTVQLSGN